jgi:gamma-glutamyltranspeptidase / glutathione hydrolase
MRARTKASLTALWLGAGALAFALGATGSRGQQVAVQHKGGPEQAVRGAQAMVVSDEQLAARVGVEILKKGGNAVDAAVAVAFTLAVVDPAAGNLGGGGFLLVRMADGRAGFVDYREMAPGKAARDMFVRADGTLDDEGSVLGYRSVAVPGSVAGLELALKTYGTMRLDKVMAPAIQLAENGFTVSEKLAREIDAERAGLERFPWSRRIFLKDGAMYKPGEIFRQPELAATLKRIAKNGSAEFYRGETARQLVKDMAAVGGLITLEDLARYRPKLRPVLRAKYSVNGTEWEVIAAPPPSSGGVALIEALNMLQDMKLRGWQDAESVHLVAEVMRRVFADRAAYLADPDFASVPVAELTAPCYAAERASEIDPQRASPSTAVRAGTPHTCGVSGGNVSSEALPQAIVGRSEGMHTTHVSVVDAAGNAVAMTTTLNDLFGSHVTSSAGFVLNDSMDDFTSKPGAPNKLFGLVQSEANAIVPGKRPLSAMTPTILLRNGQLSFVTGARGGPRIISATLLNVLSWMRLGMDAQAAINAPRFHHQWLPDELRVEAAIPESVVKHLEAMGHKVTPIGHVGLVNAIGIDPLTGERLGAADPRNAGSAEGY